jgi:hypothetical protein
VRRFLWHGWKTLDDNTARLAGVMAVARGSVALGRQLSCDSVPSGLADHCGGSPLSPQLKTVVLWSRAVVFLVTG